MTEIADGAQVIKMLRSGKSLYGVANKLGVSIDAVRYWVNKANACLPKSRQISTRCKRIKVEHIRKGQKLSPRRDEARAMKQSGMTYAQIGAKLGVSRQRAQQLVAPAAKRLREIRDALGNKCQSCGKRAKQLHCHHSDYSAEPDKLLCPSCHRLIECDEREKIALAKLADVFGPRFNPQEQEQIK